LLEEIHHLKAILEKLLLLSLADSGHLGLERHPVDLSAILTNIVEDSAALAPDLQIQSEIPNGVIVPADAILLEQALQNLTTNALKYNRPQGRVHVTLITTGGRANVTVRNTGPVIPAADHPRIFERFYRGDPARRQGRVAGIGLGLSLSREILRAHGGDLALIASNTECTEFVATLPLHSAKPNLPVTQA
jgi:two-component system heavy metal sensor histidine kinase CusS